jgi:hypothetical protein
VKRIHQDAFEALEFLRRVYSESHTMIFKNPRSQEIKEINATIESVETNYY